MKRALGEYRVEGIQTTIPFYLEIMKSNDFESANFDTGFIDRFLRTEDREPTFSPDDLERGIAVAAILEFEKAQKVRIATETDSAWKRTARLEGVSRRT